MSPKTELQQAHDDMLALLDEKLAKVPEWRIFRVIDRALRAVDAPASVKANGAAKPHRKLTRRKKLVPPSYAALAMVGFDKVGGPMPTDKVVEFIGSHRDLGSDPKKARINIQSALSKDDRIKSIPWRGGTAWWHANKPVPVDESAGLGLTQ